MSTLPPSLEALVERVLEAAHLDPASEREVRADLRDHFRDGLATGRSPDELVERFGSPEAAARRLSGGATPPPRPGGVRPSRTSWLETVVRDLRTAIRAIRKSPVTSAAVTTVLTLGVGTSVVVYSIVNELLLEPLPVEDPGSLVDIWADIPGGNSFLGFAHADFETYRESGVLEELAAFMGLAAPYGPDDSGETIVASIVSPWYLDMLGVRPALGSTAFPYDADFGEVAGVVVTHGFWQRSLGGAPDVIGSTLRLGGHVVLVMGVAQKGFTGHFIGFPSEVFLPMSSAPLFATAFDPTDRSQKLWEMIGRKGDERSADATQDALNRVAEQIEADFPELNRGHRVGVTPTTGVDHSMYSGVVVFAAILSTLSILVLVIACLNVGGVLLVRGLARDREMAVRLALGAGRRTLVRQMMTESMVLVSLGTVLGAVLASRANVWLGDWIRALSDGRLGFDLAIDARVAAMTAAAAVLAAVIASGAPALHVLRKDPASALRGRSGPSRGSVRTRSVLVVGQVAVSVVLTLAAGLFGRTLLVGSRVDPGFDADRITAFRLDLEPNRIGMSERRVVLDEVLDAASAIPSVASAAWSTSAPLRVARTPIDVEIPGVEPPPGQDRLVVDARPVGPGYLAAAGITLLQGRDFTADDEGGPRVALVSKAFVDRFWLDGGAPGRTIDVDGEATTIVGVASDARYLLQDESPDPLLYLSARSIPMQPVIVVQASDPLAITSALQAAVTAVIPSHPVIEPRTARSSLLTALLPQRAAAILVGVMGLIAFVLAAIGLYGLVQFTVTRDLPELGVRLALGAGRGDLVRVVLGKGFLLAAMGIAVGLGIALLTAGGLESLLPGVSPFDPITYGSVMGLFGAVAFLSSWFPSVRAARTHPAEALREG